jgi:ATP-dependent Clp protease ATP-binding subunit ClpB
VKISAGKNGLTFNGKAVDDVQSDLDDAPVPKRVLN